MTAIPSNAEKQQVWEAYENRRPTRVPVRLTSNPRIILLNPQLNPDGYTFEQAAKDPQIHVHVALLHQHYLYTRQHRYTDMPLGAPPPGEPGVWQVEMKAYNTYDAAFFGAPVRYLPGQIPATEPFLDDTNKHAVFDVPIDDPLSNPYLRWCMEFHREMQSVCADMEFEGRPVQVGPFTLGHDGPFTVGCNLRGTDLMIDLFDDPDYFNRLMTHITDAAIFRRQAMWDYWGDRVGRANQLADDSCTMLSVEMYRRRLMPHHRRFYEAGPPPPEVERAIHLCGDATHLFQTLHEQLNVTRFDTGFPVAHGALRAQLGPDVEISGGPPVQTLLTATPGQVYQCTVDILHSGVTTGGRFILQEGNNLPPNCPHANLEAMYAACLEHGSFHEH